MEVSLKGQIELAESSPTGTTFRVRVTCDQVRQHPNVSRPEQPLLELA
jgi:hypothetical protein